MCSLDVKMNFWSALTVLALTLAAGFQPNLTLQRVLVTSVPDTVQLTGMSAVSDSQIVSWSFVDSTVVYISRTNEGVQVESRAVPGSPIAATANVAAIAERDGITIVPMDDSEGAHSIELSSPVLQAARFDQTWYVATRDSLHRFSVLRLEPSMNRVVKIETFDGAAEKFLLTGGHDALVATKTTAPFTSFRLLQNGTVVDTLQPAQPTGDSARAAPALAPNPEGEDSKWVSLPLVPLADEGYLQTISDLKSDRRKICVFDKNGAFVRCRQIKIPIGIYDAAPGGHLLVGAIEARSSLIVGYRWRWQDPGQSPETSLRRH